MNLNKTVLITGASSGIGKELAYVYAKKSYNLILVARRIDNLNSIKTDIEASYNVNVQNIQTDLSLKESADLLFDKVKDKNIDILINNAGFGINGNFKDIDIEQETDMLMLNMVTLTRLTKLFANKMLKSNGGNIVNISSTAAFQGIPTFAAYAATKAYVLHFTEALSIEFKNTNVNFTAICPGATQSEFMETANVKNVKFLKMPTSKQVAEYTYKAVLNNKTVAVHGTINRFLVFMSRFSPRKINTYIAAKIFD